MADKRNARGQRSHQAKRSPAGRKGHLIFVYQVVEVVTACAQLSQLRVSRYPASASASATCLVDTSICLFAVTSPPHRFWPGYRPRATGTRRRSILLIRLYCSYTQPGPIRSSCRRRVRIGTALMVATLNMTSRLSTRTTTWSALTLAVMVRRLLSHWAQGRSIRPARLTMPTLLS